MGKPEVITNCLFSKQRAHELTIVFLWFKFTYTPHSQWRIQGRGPGGQGLPLFRDQTKARKAEKHFFETTPPAYVRVWMTPPPPPPPPKVWIRYWFLHLSHARGVKIAHIWHFEPWIIRVLKSRREGINGNLETATRCSYMYDTKAITKVIKSHVKPQAKFDAQKVN